MILKKSVCWVPHPSISNHLYQFLTYPSTFLLQICIFLPPLFTQMVDYYTDCSVPLKVLLKHSAMYGRLPNLFPESITWQVLKKPTGLEGEVSLGMALTFSHSLPDHRLAPTPTLNPYLLLSKINEILQVQVISVVHNGIIDDFTHFPSCLPEIWVGNQNTGLAPNMFPPEEITVDNGQPSLFKSALKLEPSPGRWLVPDPIYPSVLWCQWAREMLDLLLPLLRATFQDSPIFTHLWIPLPQKLVDNAKPNFWLLFLVEKGILSWGTDL